MFFGDQGHAVGQDASKRGPRFYELLELSKGASAADIKKAYRRLAVLHHPDKGGDPEKFKEVTRAYEVLGDADKRRLYDERGEEGVAAGGADPADIFAMFFGSGLGGWQGPGRGTRRTKDIVHPLSVSLEELYSGCMKKLAVHRNIVDEEAGVRTCEDCGGRGTLRDAARLGFLLQQDNCKACVGTGKRFKIKKSREVLEVFVEKGAPHGHKIVFSGRADEQPDSEPGDVVFIVHQKEHAEFKRRGADLFLARKIGLLEALTGFRMQITHLDGRQFIVKTNPGEVVQPLAEGTGLKAVKDEGMPTHGSPFVFGSLFLILVICFPDAIAPEAVPKLREALPGPEDEEVLDDDGAEVCFLEDMDPVESAKANTARCRGEAYEEDEGGGGARPPGCPSQ